MKLSNDLISQFVKVTNDKTESKKETTAYATVVVYNEKTYVKIDGSDLLTPVDSTVSVKDGERVSVKIIDHKATIIGNYTDPSASSKDLIKVTEDLNGYKIEVGETYTEKTEFNQLKDKFTWIVKSGDSISTMELTDEMYNVISKNITLTADRINLNGYISNDDSNWSIDQEGNLNVNNINIEGDISCDSINFKDINNPKILQCLNESIELLVNTDTGSDDWSIDEILESYDDAEEKNDNSLKKRYKSIQGAVDAIPKFLNNKTVYITMETDSAETVYVRGLVGGALRIYTNGKTLYGTIKSYVCAASITVYGGTKSNPTGAIGIIHPKVGLSFGSRAVSVGFEASQYAALYNLKVYAPDNLPSDITNTDKVCVGSQSGTGSVYCKNVEIVNAVIGFRSNNHGNMHVNSSSGIASKYGFQAATGGVISIANNNQAGGSTSPTNKNGGGQIWHDENGPTFASGGSTTDPTPAPSNPTTKTISIKSSYGDTYRSSVYNNWKKDGSVRQGDYGYGDCNGCWFFGSAFGEVKGKTITKVTITITRQGGGSHAATGLVVKSHGYSGRPSGAPSYRTTAGTLSLATGATGTLTITNSTILSEISSGKVKGFGIQSAYNASSYAVCSGSVTVKITYKE